MPKTLAVRALSASFRPCGRSLLATLTAALLLCAPISAPAIGVFVTSNGASTPGTCTLAQAIGMANYANSASSLPYFLYAQEVGSATTTYGTCISNPPPQPPSTRPPAGNYDVIVTAPVVQLSSIDNYWYGPNALPAITSNIVIVPVSGTLQLVAAHTGDPTPATADAFRFFYVSGGLELPAGSLTLVHTTLKGGYAKGGNHYLGGGGAGMGGAIFNQGQLSLQGVSLLGNTAQGGNLLLSGNGGGGMGQDAQMDDVGDNYGGGFGGPIGTFSSSGASAGGGAGFFGGPNTGNAGAGLGALGGAGGGATGGAAGDGGGAGAGGVNLPGGKFGSAGGVHTCQDLSCNNAGGSGGGVGGGGGHGAGQLTGGGGGGFGGGGGGYGGLRGGSGGFGGGAGVSGGTGGGGTPGFGGAPMAAIGGVGPAGGAGSGMGGVVFNHGGSVRFLNVTATGNVASGGNASSCLSPSCRGSGLGAVLFNLNGSVTVDFSTLVGNTVAGNNGLASNSGPEDATVYSLAYGNTIQDGSQSVASLTINNSIIRLTRSDGGAGNDIVAHRVDGAHSNASSVTYTGVNFASASATFGSATQSGASPSTTDPLLGPLSVYAAAPYPLPVFPLGAISPAAFDPATQGNKCQQADLGNLAVDEIGTVRPYNAVCNVGAYQFNGDYIFANGVEPVP